MINDHQSFFAVAFDKVLDLLIKIKTEQSEAFLETKKEQFYQ